MSIQLERRALDIFSEIVSRTPQDPARGLDEACGGDVALRQRVATLLANDRSWDSFDQGALGRSEPPHEAALPDFARFSEVSILGHGAYGDVYSALQDHPRRRVAIKLLRSKAARALNRFKLEADALARLAHPGIVQIYEVGIEATRGAPFIVMEFVDGQPLGDFAQSRGLGWRERIELIIQICDIIEFAHENRVIHRDLKPANVLVTLERGRPRCRVLDFGMARLADAAQRGETLPGEVVGTIGYMAPEQIDADPQVVDKRADVYAIGVMLFELLTGRQPIDVQDLPAGAALARVHTAEPLRLADLDRRFRGDLDRIVARAVARERAERYPSAAALACHLRSFLLGEPVPAETISLTHSMRRFAQRHRGAVAVGATVLLLLVAGLSGTSYGLFEARRATGETIDVATMLVQDIISLQPVAGTTAFRMRTLPRLIDNIVAVRARRPDSLPLRVLHADALENLADAECSLDLLDDALRRRTLSLQLRREVMEKTGLVNHTRAYATAVVKLGDVHKLAGRTESASDYYQLAHLTLLELQRRAPDDYGIADDLMWSHVRHGYAAKLVSDHEGAERWFESGLAISDAWASRAGADPRWLHARLALEFRLLGLHCLGKPGSDCLAEGERICALARELAASDAQNRDFETALIDALHIHATLLLQSGLLDEARSAALEALAMLRKLTYLDSGQSLPSLMLHGTLHLLARIEQAAGQEESASSYAREADSLLDQLPLQ